MKFKNTEFKNVFNEIITLILLKEHKNLIKLYGLNCEQSKDGTAGLIKVYLVMELLEFDFENLLRTN